MSAKVQVLLALGLIACIAAFNIIIGITMLAIIRQGG